VTGFLQPNCTYIQRTKALVAQLGCRNPVTGSRSRAAQAVFCASSNSAQQLWSGGSMKSCFVFPAAMAIMALPQPTSAQSAHTTEVDWGSSYVGDGGEGPTTPTIAAGTTQWISKHLGVGLRGTFGLRNNYSPIQDRDRIEFGPGGLWIL